MVAKEKITRWLREVLFMMKSWAIYPRIDAGNVSEMTAGYEGRGSRRHDGCRGEGEGLSTGYRYQTTRIITNTSTTTS
jgi:hypothetical protein